MTLDNASAARQQHAGGVELEMVYDNFAKLTSFNIYEEAVLVAFKQRLRLRKELQVCNRLLLREGERETS